MTKQFKLTKKLVSDVLKVVDVGLCFGLGRPVPGEMCVEAAVCYVMGLDHNDNPTCVSPSLRALKISLNDKNWSSPKARAKGLRRLAVLQLGTANTLDEKEFVARLLKLVITKTVSFALTAASKVAVNAEYKTALQKSAKKCQQEGTRAAVIEGREIARHIRNANIITATIDTAIDTSICAVGSATLLDERCFSAAAAYAVNAVYCSNVSGGDPHLAEFAEDVVQILIDMKVPAIKYLNLTNKGN